MIYSLKHICIINGRLAVSKEFLFGYGVHKEAIRFGLRRNALEGLDSWQHVEKGQCWIYYDSIPYDTCGRYALPTAEAVESMMETRGRKALYYLENHLNAALTHGYHDYTDYYYRQYRNDSDSVIYAKQAAVLAAACDAWANHRGGLSIDTFCEKIAELNTGIDLKKATLYSKFHHIRKGGAVTDLITKKRAGNDNAKKIDDFTSEYIKNIYLTGNLTYQMVWETYTKHALTGGVVDQSSGEVIRLKNVSLSSVKNILTAPDFVPAATLVRLGKAAFNDRYAPYIKGHRPQYGLSIVGMDDEHIPLQLRLDGVNTAKRLKAIYLFDGATRAVVGLAMGLESNFDLYLAAIRSMLLGEVVPQTRGYIPAELQVDRFTQKQESIYQKTFRKINFGNLPQGRYAERDIEELETRHFRTVKGWVGMGVKTRLDHSRTNPDAPRVRYNVSETMEIVTKVVSDYNKPKLKGLIIHPELKKLPDELLALYAGVVKEIKPKRGYVEFTHEGVRYSYLIPNWDDMLEKIESFSVRIAVLEDEPETAYIFKPKAEIFLGAAARTQSIQRAGFEQTEEDKKLLGKGLKRRTIFVDKAEEKATKILEMNVTPVMYEAEAETILLSPLSETTKEERQKAEERLNFFNDDEQDETPEPKTHKRATRFAKY